MTLRRFLDAAFALLVEGHIAGGVAAGEALEHLAQYRARTMTTTTRTEDYSATSVARRNDESLKRLGALMGGV